MANREFLAMPANAPQTVTWYLASYYASDADGTSATTVGVQFKTYDDAVNYARNTLASAGVGCVYIQQVSGSVVYPLYQPVSA